MAQEIEHVLFAFPTLFYFHTISLRCVPYSLERKSQMADTHKTLDFIG